MATVYRIHPAIGIARVGNSPEMFVGPERLGERPTPPGGFKDAQCRVKRQAARFRIFAHHDDGSVEEINHANAEITWTVHLVNKKAAHPNRGNTEPAADLTIDPGARMLTSPLQGQAFSNGQIKFAGAAAVTVPLGELQSDSDNHLLVLGGAGNAASPLGTGIGHFWMNADWFDDISDGPVSATIKIRATGATPAVTGAWVIVAPPKFAPHQDSVITLYDRVFQAMVDGGFAAAPAATSYTRDVFPILQRATDTRWVESIGAFPHAWTHPVISTPLREAIFNRLKQAGGNMPPLNGSDGQLTPVQFAHMQRWKDNNFTNDWAGVPAPEANITPAGMDQAALEACVGGAFFPGIEAGGLDAGDRPILAAANYSETFRVNHGTVPPGTISMSMALPWQADFKACGDNWWPVPRPNEVFPQGQSAQQEWDRGVASMDEMVTKWHSLGFVVEQGSQKVEVERCDQASITLLTPHLDFQDVPQGPMGMVRETPLAITFEVISPSGAVTLEYDAGGGPVHSQLVAANTSVTAGPTAANAVATARLWVIYRTGAAPSSIPVQTLTIRQQGTAQTWTVTVTGNTVARATTAAALVLDRSGSMSEDRGDGQTKHRSLQEAASIFIDVMLEGDGAGIVRYDQDAQVLKPVLPLGNGQLSDINRGALRDTINGNDLDPAGATSIGDGIFEGRGILNAATGAFDRKAMVILTDGKENRSRFIADVAAQVNHQTYAIGFGTPQNTSAAALQILSGNNGGFLLVTGAIGSDNRFLLQKFFLQILAGVSNADIVLDPDGQLFPGVVQQIPFELTEADAGIDVILLTPKPHGVDFRLQTPEGTIIEPWRALAEPAMRFVMSNGVAYYRLVLPAQLDPGRFSQPGTWRALIGLGRPRLEPTRESQDGVDRVILEGLNAPRSARSPRYAAIPNEARRAFEVAQAQSGSSAAGDVAAAVANTRGGVPYSLSVHAYSNISLRAQIRQTGWEPGDKAVVTATLAEAGLPLRQGGHVWADVRRPDGSTVTIAFSEGEPGSYEAALATGIPGVYSLRVRARGTSRKGVPFTRERTVTAAVWHGGNTPATPGRTNEVVDYLRDRDQRLCDLMRCLAGGAITPELERRLREQGVDLEHARKCLERYCKSIPRPDERNDG